VTIDRPLIDAPDPMPDPSAERRKEPDVAKGQYLSSYQKSIVNRYYANADARVVNALQEIVSEIAVAETEAARTKQWKRAHDHLLKTTLDPKEIARVVTSKSLTDLAAIVGELSGSKSAVRSDRPPTPKPVIDDSLDA
jgi:hypothetical protein